MPSQKTSAAMKCIKILLHMFNFVYLILGVCILAIGIWTQIELQDYMKLSGLYYDNSSYAMIAVGVVILLVAIAGFYCTAKSAVALLYLYGFFIGIVAIAQLAAGIAGAVYSGSLQDAFEKGMMNSIEHSQDNMESWNKVQKLLQCCGVKSASDWTDHANRSIPASCYANDKVPATTTVVPTTHNVETTTTEEVTTTGQNITTNAVTNATSIVPVTTNQTIPDVTTSSILPTSASSNATEDSTGGSSPSANSSSPVTSSSSVTTVGSATTTESSPKRRKRSTTEEEPFVGCEKLIVDKVTQYLAAIIGVCIGFVFLQVAGAILACLLARRTNKNNYEQIY
ncbi:tetraspanin-1-like [Watersipora subatra]|uniref:tetraspanin-1-like n=1 Tax=Watersipora subatra TaxID=2589382 RepID=UPI00355AE3A3